MGFIEGVASILGSGIGSMMDRDRDSNALRDKYNYLKRQGLTPQEIAGSSFGANPSTTSANTLGNQAAEMAKLKAQQRYDEGQRELDRAVAVRGQDVANANAQISANASVASAGISAGPATAMLPFNQELSRLQQRLTAMQTMVGVDQNSRQHLASARNVLEAYLSAPVGSPQRDTYGNQLKAIAIENAGGMLGNALRMFNPTRVLGRGSGSSSSSGVSSPTLGSSRSGPSRNSRGLTPSQRIESKNYGHVVD